MAIAGLDARHAKNRTFIVRKTFVFLLLEQKAERDAEKLSAWFTGKRIKTKTRKSKEDEVG